MVLSSSMSGRRRGLAPTLRYCLTSTGSGGGRGRGSPGGCTAVIGDGRGSDHAMPLVVDTGRLGRNNGQIDLPRRRIEVWTTTCIVTNFGHRQHPFVKPSTTVAAAATLASGGTSVASTANATTEVVFDSTLAKGEPPKHSYVWVLANPANAGLTGCRNFPYFPRGGPVPELKVTSGVHKDWQPLGYVSQWGGMNVGDGMLYAVSVVDGLVHQMGGWKLQAELKGIRFWHSIFDTNKGGTADSICPIGSARTTTAGNDTLALNYDVIVHTTPPFYKYRDNEKSDPEADLVRCYESVLKQAFDPTISLGQNTTAYNSTGALLAAAAWVRRIMMHPFWNSPFDVQNGSGIKLAVPLLGAGARGFPVSVACRAAAQALVPWLVSSSPNVYKDLPARLQSPKQSTATIGRDSDRNFVVAIGLLDEPTAEIMVDALVKEFQRLDSA